MLRTSPRMEIPLASAILLWNRQDLGSQAGSGGPPLAPPSASIVLALSSDLESPLPDPLLDPLVGVSALLAFKSVELVSVKNMVFCYKKCSVLLREMVFCYKNCSDLL